LINGDSILAVIPARGGSKGLPRKNILPFSGQPMINWTIQAAHGSRYIDRVILSSDDLEIMQVAAEAGCEVPFRRPAELADDTSNSTDVALHAIKQVRGYDWLILLQPTSPLRSSIDIDSAIELCMHHNAISCVSVCEVSESPYWMYTLNGENRLMSLLPQEQIHTRRQDLTPAYSLNGAIYLIQTETLSQSRSFIGNDTVAYVMPRERSVDVDSADDLMMALPKMDLQGRQK
jgi:N-acylneuraminate cytidylyltransferase